MCKDTSTAATLVVLTAPSISMNPSNDSTCVNGDASFTATGSQVESGSLSYQWQESTNGGTSFSDISDGGIFTNTSSTTLNLTNVQSSDDEHQYRLIILETTGTIVCNDTSTAATLVVLTAPSISMNPSNDSTCVNGDASFSAIGSQGESGSLTYQWQESNDGTTFNDIADAGIFSGSATANLSLTTVPVSIDNYFYRVIVTEKVGTIACPDTSSTANLQVFSKPTLTLNAVNDTTCSNGNAKFVVTAINTDGGNLSYQWQESADGTIFSNINEGGIFNGTTNDTLKHTGVTTVRDNYAYRVIITETVGTIACPDTSVIGLLKVHPNPDVTGLAASSSDICTANDATISLANATALIGNFIFNYDIDGTNDTTATINMSGGAGDFSISNLTVGSRTINVTSIVDSNTCLTAIAGVNATLEVVDNPIIDTTGQALTNICGTTIDLSVIIPNGSTGEWTIPLSNPLNSGTLSSTTTTSTTLTGVFGANYTLRWTTNSGVCTGRFSEIIVDFNPDEDLPGNLPDGVQDCVDICLGGDDTQNTDGLGIPDDCDCDLNDTENEFVDFNDPELTAAVDDAINLFNFDTIKPTADFEMTSMATVLPKIIGTYPTVIMRGGNNVLLLPGFHAQAGSDFIAKVEYCRDPITGIPNLQSEEEQAIQSLIVPLSVNILGAADEIALSVQPNITNQLATIRIDLPIQQTVTLSLHNQHGQKVVTFLEQDWQGKGVHTFELNAQSLPSGIYFLRLQGKATLMTEKVVVAR